MIDYKKDLNKEQYKVVTEADGPCLVLAGAGSGKTRTLVYRTAYLIEKGIKPENILLVTFTNKAANEMMERVTSLLNFDLPNFQGGTFHRIANRILRKYADRLGYTRGFTILDQEDSVSQIKSAMEEIGVKSANGGFPKPKAVQGMISYARNTNQEVKEVVENYYGYPDFIARKVEDIAFIYHKKNKSSSAMDFDDLLLNWLKLLQQFPDIKEKLSRQFEYILVDEYQDTNHIQAGIIQHLASFHRNVLVVGDDSQSIYSFRAADVKNILDFPKLFPETKIYKIETNYRSSPQILDFANEIIKNNINQYQKKLKPICSDDCLPGLIVARDENQQAVQVIKNIMRFHREGVDYKSMAVLFRASYQSADLQLEMAKQNIPYVVRGGMRYFEQAHIKDIVAYLKVWGNPTDQIAWQRILLNRPGIGIKKAQGVLKKIQDVSEIKEILNTKIELSGQAGLSWQKVCSVFQYFLELDSSQKGYLAEAIKFILDQGYEQYLKDNYENYRDRMDDLNQLMNFVAMYLDLDKLLADVMLSENYSADNKKEENAVILSTIHQAKGLEWPVVFIIGMRDGHFPHHKSLENSKELEEERRLFYVAATRAKNILNLLYPQRSFSYKFGEVFSRPSQFIREIDKTKYMEQGQRSDFSMAGDDFDDGESVIYVD